MVSILDILSGAVPLMVDVRQTGGSPGTGGKLVLVTASDQIDTSVDRLLKDN
jgi:hypothetical protein